MGKGRIKVDFEYVSEGHPLQTYLRWNRLPHKWCPGCGIGIVLSCYLRALKELNIDLNKVVTVSGIGCTGRLASYVNTDGAHVLHGRAIPFAMGVKIAKPHLKVVVISGDGDLLGIGLNHLIHAARRNVELTVIEVNNMVYAMTGGQLAPTTPRGVYTTTTPKGNVERPINIIKILGSIKIPYLARWCVTHPRLLINSIKKALRKEGFSFIEVISPCVEVFGRHIGIRDPVEFYLKLKEKIVIKNTSPENAELDWNGKIICGEFLDLELGKGYVSMITSDRRLKP